MQETAADLSSHGVPDFAGLLSAVISPARTAAPVWNDDDLAEDVATLSYESALRAHARYIPADRADEAAPALGFRIARDGTTRASENSPGAMRKGGDQRSCNFRNPQPADDPLAEGQKDRKSASITIRLSKAECEQLHKRAAEAGLTVSAYLRSCTLEAEALRAQVKEALAALRALDSAGPQRGEAFRRSWVYRLFRRHR